MTQIIDLAAARQVRTSSRPDIGRSTKPQKHPAQSAVILCSTAGGRDAVLILHLH
jgi:hypothetical protein